VARFDTDAKAIRIDNCASYCISNDRRDFITPLKKVNKHLKGLGGTLADIYSGTIKWSIEDDDGVPHDLVIPNGLYVKDSPSKLLSPQHWAQTAQDFKPLPRGTWCSTYHDCIQLHWAQRQHTKTVRLTKGSGNIATMYTAPSYKAFSTFCNMCEVELDEDDPIISMVTHLIPDDENEDFEEQVHQARFAPKEVGQVPGSNLHQLLVWKSHQKTMENQAKGWSTRWKTSNSLRAGTVHQHRSVGVQHSRAHRPNQGLAHQEKVQGGNNLCGSLQWFVLHPPSEVNQCR